MCTLTTPWEGDHDQHRNCSQLVDTEFKSGSTDLKHTIVSAIQIGAPSVSLAPGPRTLIFT